MNFRRSPIFVHISDINKQINEHERLVLVCKDKTASFAFKTLDIGTLFFRKREWYETVSEDEIITYCKTQIAGFKCPRSITFQTEPLPLSGAGKILKTELRKPFWAGGEKNVN